MSRPLWPSTRIPKTKGKYKLEDLGKCSSKILLARSETDDPLDLLLTSSSSAERSRGKEGQTCPEVTSPDPKSGGQAQKSWDPREVTPNRLSSSSISQSPELLLHMSPPPWGYDQEVSFVLHRRKGHSQTKSAP